MNQTIKEADVRRFYYDTHEQLRTHLDAFVAAYYFAKRLQTLKGITPFEFGNGQSIRKDSQQTQTNCPIQIEQLSWVTLSGFRCSARIFFTTFQTHDLLKPGAGHFTPAFPARQETPPTDDPPEVVQLPITEIFQHPGRGKADQTVGALETSDRYFLENQ